MGRRWDDRISCLRASAGARPAQMQQFARYILAQPRSQGSCRASWHPAQCPRPEACVMSVSMLTTERYCMRAHAQEPPGRYSVSLEHFPMNAAIRGVMPTRVVAAQGRLWGAAHRAAGCSGSPAPRMRSPAGRADTSIVKADREGHRGCSPRRDLNCPNATHGREGGCSSKWRAANRV